MARKVLLSAQVVVAVAFLATACDRIVDPALPSTAASFTPPPVYDKWWAMVESCSGVSRPLANVTWFGIPGSVFQLDRDIVTGYWTAGSNRIVLADSARLDGSVVRHEMLHALIRQSGHPRVAFLQKCAGLVSCTPECVSDAGTSAVGDDYPTIPIDSVEVSVEILPNPPTFAVDAGVFSVVVSARNKTSHQAKVLLVSNVQQPAAGPFAYELRLLGTPSPRIGGTGDVFDPSVGVFQAGETKRQYFDFHIGSAVRNKTVVPGGYKVTGSYLNRSASLNEVIIAPP